MKKLIIQNHHVTYDPEWTELIYKGEHWVLSQLGRRKYHSMGFIRSMKYELIKMEKVAVELTREE